MSKIRHIRIYWACVCALALASCTQDELTDGGNTLPDGRDVMRAKGLLEMLAPGEKKTHSIKFTFTEE